MPTYRITVEYDGTGFVGWQVQKDGCSIQGSLEDALFKLSGENASIIGSGRTDAGVHSFGQVASFSLEKEMSPSRIRDGLNAHLRPLPISVLHAEIVPDDFHARFSAERRHYVYKVISRRSPLALMRNRAYQVYVPLDLKAMQKAARLLIGKHDFSTFRAAECQAASPIKTMEEIKIEQDGKDFSFFFTAPSFLHHQVRNIVGSLIYVGNGKWTINDFENAFKACDRTKGGPTAPAAGLYFLKVDYPF